MGTLAGSLGGVGNVGTGAAWVVGARSLLVVIVNSLARLGTASQLHTQSSLELRQNGRARNRLASLILVDDNGLLVDFL